MKLDLLKVLIDHFVKYKRSLGFKYFTEEQKMKYFYNYLVGLKKDNFDLTDDVIIPYISQNNTESKRSRDIRYTLIRQFLLYLHNLNYNVYIPQFCVENQQIYVPYIFSYNEIDKIIDCIDKQKRRGQIYYTHFNYPCLFRLLYSTGVRIAEALNITLDCISCEQGIIKILHSKFNNSRFICLSDSMNKYLIDFIKKYHSASDKNTFLFRNKNNQPLGYAAVFSYFKRTLLKPKLSADVATIQHLSKSLIFLQKFFKNNFR
jgi:site-specific recombinase XerD